ncbi:MAG TPA: hypothetical protein VM261_15065 [Kofleriaceae bacterium]|nr:hypothetical protein [Kofleriaceae bacterium]
MRRLSLLWFVLLAACGPRAVLGHGATDPATARSHDDPRGDGAAPGAAPGADMIPNAPGVVGVNLYDEPVAGGSLLDRPINVVSATALPARPTVAPTGERASGIVISRLPAPHRVAAAEAPAPRSVADAFALVGHRDSRDSLAFALAVAASLGGTVPTYVPGPAASPSAVNDGPALVEWARDRNTFVEPGAHAEPARLAPGDLVVFDRAAAGAPASLVGVVLATDARGVTSFIYLARNVVRIGHLDPARPHIARDREGRTVNSYLRHTTDYPPAGTRYLAGELLAGSIRLSSAR